MTEVDTNLCVSFEPQAFRDHFEGDDPDPTEEFTNEQLHAMGQWAIASDRLWELFHELLVDAIDCYEKGLIDA